MAKTPSVVGKKVAKAGDGTKKKSKKRIESYSTYIYKVSLYQLLLCWWWLLFLLTFTSSSIIIRHDLFIRSLAYICLCI
jgi:hypothetical protein